MYKNIAFIKILKDIKMINVITNGRDKTRLRKPFLYS